MIEAYYIRNNTQYLLKCGDKAWLVDKKCETDMEDIDRWWNLHVYPEELGELVTSAETVGDIIIKLKMETLLND